MNTPARQFLTEFVMEKAVAEPLNRRMCLYRALAAELPEASDEFSKLTALADELESIEEKHQLVLDFQRRSISANPFGQQGRSTGSDQGREGR